MTQSQNQSLIDKGNSKNKILNNKICSATKHSRMFSFHFNICPQTFAL
jgi:hypothetical protein